MSNWFPHRNLVETTALSESGIRVLTADNGEFSVILGEDDSLNRSVTEVKGNGNEGGAVVVNILDVVGGPSSVNRVAVISAVNLEFRDGGTDNVGFRVDDGNTEGRILGFHVKTRIGVSSVVEGVPVPVDIRAEDGTTSQLFHQFSSAPLGFEVNTSEGFKTVDTLAVLGSATFVLEFDGGDGGGENGQ